MFGLPARLEFAIVNVSFPKLAVLSNTHLQYHCWCKRRNVSYSKALCVTCVQENTCFCSSRTSRIQNYVLMREHALTKLSHYSDNVGYPELALLSNT